jgi:hypothetical protein
MGEMHFRTAKTTGHVGTCPIKKRYLPFQFRGHPRVVRILEGNNFSLGCCDTPIAGCRWTSVGLTDNANSLPERSQLFQGVVCRPVVDHDYFDVLISLLKNIFNRFADQRGAIVGRDNDADGRLISHGQISQAC